MILKFYHNPRCQKSRQALELIKDKGVEPEIILYLQTQLSEFALKGILKKLNIKAENLVRKNEKVYKEKFKGKSYTEKEWIKILINNPKLIERPILETDEKAAIGRPPEQVLELL